MFTLSLPRFAWPDRWLRRPALRRQPKAVSWSGLNKNQAEEALDWLEATGGQNARLIFQDGQGFTVESCTAVAPPSR